MSDLYSVELEVKLPPAVATGHVAIRRDWVDTPAGRRPGDEPMRDEQGRLLPVVDVLLGLGRDGQPVVFGVTVPSYEEPTVDPLSLVTFEGLRAYIRPPKTGKGVEVSLSAEAMQVQGAAKPAGRRSGAAESEGAA